jgi:uncharacterized protein DUF1569
MLGLKDWGIGPNIQASSIFNPSIHMTDLNQALIRLHGAVAEFVAAAAAAAPRWTVPRAPGKWSPSQVVEHVARIMEESANVAAGDRSKFPSVARLLRPIARLFFFQRVLRRNSFLTMKTAPPFDPASGSPTPVRSRVRVEQALARFDKACRGRESGGAEVSSTIFGDVSVADFARFQELHVRHHLPQLAESAEANFSS